MIWVGFVFKDVWYLILVGIWVLGCNCGVVQIVGDWVDYMKIFVYVFFNRFIGWCWGIFDVLFVVWWIKVYKEYLENCLILMKVYVCFVWKVMLDCLCFVCCIVVVMVQVLCNDLVIGQLLNIGVLVVLGVGQDFLVVGGNMKVDFDVGCLFVVMIVVVFDVLFFVLMEDLLIVNNVVVIFLDILMIFVMQVCQKVMDEMFCEIFKVFGLKVRLCWFEIFEELIYCRFQVFDMVICMGLFLVDEVWVMVVDVWGDKWEDFVCEVLDVKDFLYVFGGGGQGQFFVLEGFNFLEILNNFEGNFLVGMGGFGVLLFLKVGNLCLIFVFKQLEFMFYGDYELCDELILQYFVGIFGLRCYYVVFIDDQ